MFRTQYLLSVYITWLFSYNLKTETHLIIKELFAWSRILTYAEF